ncbi:hypothetical protein SAMN05660209_00588 [Geodermatophilus africanus]|uniref:Uncharacterized protein n=1 Tax=Geodermatophilus africanus TaxID=1137993 RepID=A0A1H3CDQ6_9ACTN|nr:hypothetical protein [Geodermatophilus africanus]SDX52215.1 hypothetical protein SAMN05660209_00588 [Geodermatophilus africanus]
MSAISGNRAAVFTQQSQHCEVFVEGVWWPGSLLGWRHDGGGACEMWVRVTVAGVERETWSDLADVRLAQVRPAPVLVPDSGSDPFAALGGESLPGAAAAPLLSLSEAAAREQRVAGVLSAPAPAAGRRRRRHGGDVTAEQPAVHGPSAGRHRAGRHRVAEEAAQVEEVRPAEPSDATVLMPRATEVDCLTRPLRLGDRVARPRLPRAGGALRA